MLGLRSARGRAILGGVALTLFMICVIVLTIGRNELHNRRLDKLAEASDAATTLEHARAQLYLQTGLLSGLALSHDASLVDKFHEAQAELEQDLIQIRAEATLSGHATQLALLDDLTERMTRFEEMADTAIPLLLEMEPATARELAAGYLPSVSGSLDAMFVDLNQLAEDGRADLAAERAAVEHEKDITYWLTIALSALGSVSVFGIVTVLLLSVLRPLSSVRLSARAIAAGNLQARAKVFGPEEVASLARDFNQMTDALAEKTKEYIATTNLTGDIICRVDTRGKWTFLNDAACAFLGKPRERLLGTSAMAVMHTDDAERTRQAGREAAARKEPVRGFVNRVITQAGIRVVEWNAHPLFDDKGEYVGIQMTGRDMTQRIQMEETLRESENRYRMLAENTSDLIWIVDLSLKYTYMSPAVTHMRGYTVEEIVGTSIQETMTPASVEAARKTLAEQLAIEREGNVDPNRSTKLDLEMYCKDGSTIWTEMNMTFLRDAEGKPTGILGVTRDITERKRTEEALAESESRYRLLAENTSDLIWTMDLSLRYTYMSPAITRMRGYTVAEVIGSSGQETLTPASLEVARKALAEELAAEATGAAPGRGRKLDLEMYCKDGSTIWTEMSMNFLRDAEGRPTGILGVTRDITERKRAEEESERLNAELKTQAITDSLTGLYNHAHFYQRLAHEIDRSGRYGHRFALVMMDIDSFKHYNDSRGHQAGDEVLRLVGECIQSAMRRSDLAFRYGGDEFVAILLDADVLKAQDIVRRINRRITARLKELGDPAAEWLGVSAGVVCFPEDAATADELVGLADLAMYDAKRLAWARGVMGRARPGGPAGGPAVWVTETVHETQTKVLSGAASELAAALQDLTAPQVLSDIDLRTLAALSAAAEIKDPYIHGHQERTSHLAATVAQEMGLSPDRVRNLTTAGLLHDLGKVNVGESILNKPGKLSESELAEVKEHASFGAAMITSGVGALQPLAPIVRHHHERFDGNGYPDGLARENIPLEARILGVVDAFDAMTHERAYRKALSTEEALGEIQRGAGTLFDRTVVEAFLGVVTRGSGSV